MAFSETDITAEISGGYDGGDSSLSYPTDTLGGDVPMSSEMSPVDKEKQNKKYAKWFLIVIVVLMVLMYMGNGSNSNSSNNPQKNNGKANAYNPENNYHNDPSKKHPLLMF